MRYAVSKVPRRESFGHVIKAMFVAQRVVTTRRTNPPPHPGAQGGIFFQKKKGYLKTGLQAPDFIPYQSNQVDVETTQKRPHPVIAALANINPSDKRPLESSEKTAFVWPMFRQLYKLLFCPRTICFTRLMMRHRLAAIGKIVAASWISHERTRKITRSSAHKSTHRPNGTDRQAPQDAQE